MTVATGQAACLTPFLSRPGTRYGPRRWIEVPRSTMPSGGGKESETMPVPIPRQRAIPAVESGQAPAAPKDAPAEEAPRKEATVDNNATTQLSLLVIEDDPGGATGVPQLPEPTRQPRPPRPPP